MVDGDARGSAFDSANGSETKGGSAADTVRQSAIAIVRVFGALLVTYVFLLLMFTAIAQQRVLSQLEEQNIDLSYSAADAISNDRAALRERVYHLVSEGRRIDDARAAAEVEHENLTSRYASTLSIYIPAAAHLVGQCNQTLPTALEDDFSYHHSIWQAVLACESLTPSDSLGQRPSARLQEQYQILTSLATDIDAKHSQWAQLRARYNAIQRRLGQINEEVSGSDEAIAESQRAESIRQSFSEVGTLRKSAWMGGQVLAGIPPSILLLLLAAVAGTFGALIVTLVLVVYPNNKIALTQASSSLGARILLGGLIAVCVYILIAGGTAVLGASNALASGEANYMTFCAVGILAGMFSDRVASWLSSRADVLFTSSKVAKHSSGTP